MLPVHLRPIRAAEEPRHHRVVNDWQMYVWEDVDKFAEDYGIDYTVINRDIYYWDIHLAWKILPPLDEAWISESPRIVEYGNSLATRGVVTNGRGFAGVDEAGLPTTGPKGFGFVDDLVNNANESDTGGDPVDRGDPRLAGDGVEEHLRSLAAAARDRRAGQHPSAAGLTVEDQPT